MCPGESVDSMEITISERALISLLVADKLDRPI